MYKYKLIVMISKDDISYKKRKNQHKDIYIDDRFN